MRVFRTNWFYAIPIEHGEEQGIYVPNDVILGELSLASKICITDNVIIKTQTNKYL